MRPIATDVSTTWRMCGARSSLVRIEQTVVGATREYSVELPREIDRVPDAGAEPLAHERRRLVRGVARQQHRPDAPTLRDQRVKPIDRKPNRIQRCFAAPWSEQRPEGLPTTECLARFTGQKHELPASAARTCRDARRWSARIAELECGIRRQSDVLLQARIDNRPWFVEAEVVHRH